MRRLGVRRRLFLVVVMAVAAALAIMIVAFNVLLAHNLSADADRVLRSRATDELELLRLERGKLVVARVANAAVAETNVWVFAGDRTLEAPRTGAIIAAAAGKLRDGPFGIESVPAVNSKLYAKPVLIDGRRRGTVVAAVSLAPYSATRREALLDSLMLGAGVLLLVVVAASWLLSSSLKPVTRMTRQAANWSDSELDRRFGYGEPYDELTELAATLDGLLDRLAASLRREKRFSAELSHELRTPLARVIAEADLALSRERAPGDYRDALELVRRNAQQLTRIVDSLVAAERQAASSSRGTSDAVAAVNEAAAACTGLAAERGVSIEIEQPPRPVRLGVDADIAERILQPVIENGCRYSRAKVAVSVERLGAGVVFEIADDGPGVSDEEREQIFEPGARGKAGRASNSSGAGLGLSLARRLARGVDGEVEAGAGNGHGRFFVHLPAG